MTVTSSVVTLTRAITDQFGHSEGIGATQYSDNAYFDKEWVAGTKDLHSRFQCRVQRSLRSGGSDSPSGSGTWWIYVASGASPGTLTLGLQSGLTMTSGGAFSQVTITQLPLDAACLYTGHVTLGTFEAVGASCQAAVYGPNSFSAGANITIVKARANVQISAAVGSPAGSGSKLQYNNSGAFGGVAGSSVSGGNITVAGTINGNSITSGGSVFAGDAFAFTFPTHGSLVSPSDGVWTLRNNATNGWGRLQFGGTTASFPSLRQNGAGLDFRLADDSGYTTAAVGATIIYRCTVAGTLEGWSANISLC